MSLGNALELFLKDAVLSRKSDKTVNNYIFSITGLSNYIIRALPQQDVTLITKHVLEDYFLCGINERRWKKYTHWSHYKNLAVFFKWCVKVGYLVENPLSYIPKPRLPHPYPKSLQEQEVRQLLDLLDRLEYKNGFTKVRNKALVTILFFTGMRRGEVLNLKYQDIDLETDFIYVNNGKGGKSREIPIENSTLKPVLLSYLIERNKHFSVNDWFFKYYSQLDGKKLSERAIRAIFGTLSKRFGKRVYPHMFRHTFATLLLEKTGDIYVLKELLGHSDIKTTTIYLSTTRQKKIEAISSLNFH